MGVVNLGILIKKLSSVFLKKSEVDTVLATDGYIKNTDYPTSTIAGVVKLNSNRSVGHANGALQTITVTAENYDAMNNAAFIGKGTLENIVGTLVQREIVKALGGLDADASGTTLTAWKATKGDDGWTISATKS